MPFSVVRLWFLYFNSGLGLFREINERECGDCGLKAIRAVTWDNQNPDGFHSQIAMTLCIIIYVSYREIEISALCEEGYLCFVLESYLRL